MFFQSFIFEGIITGMKIQTLIIVVFYLSWNLILRAQDPQITAIPDKGCDTLTVEFSYSTTLSSVTSWLWDFGDGTTNNLDSYPVIKYQRPGRYRVTLTLNGSQSSSIFVNVGKTPQKDSLNLSINYRDSSVLGPSIYAIDVSYNNKDPFPYSYQWTINGVNVNNNKLFAHKFDTTGTYAVNLLLTDSVGCKASFMQNITVAGTIHVPDYFTPNGLHPNFIITYNEKDIISFKVFTRTGLLIYQTEAVTISWDGRFPSGDDVLPGLYYYTLETNNPAAPIKKAGFFYIFR